MADDWRVRIELADEHARETFTKLLEEGLSPAGEAHAEPLQGDELSVSGDDANLFVYANAPAQAERAHTVILAELEHHGIEARTSGVEHWLADEERWDNEPAGDTWEAEAVDAGIRALGGRLTCRSATTRSPSPRSSSPRDTAPCATGSTCRGGRLVERMPSRCAARLHGDVEPGGAVAWEEAIDSHVVRPFAFFG